MKPYIENTLIVIGHLLLWLFALMLVIAEASCVSVSRTTKDGSTSRAVVLGTNADCIVVDGAAPVIIGYQAIYSADGKTVTKLVPIFSAMANTDNYPLYTSLNANQSRGLGKVTSTVMGSVGSYVTGTYVEKQ